MKIIIIDDEIKARETIKDILKISGYETNVIAEASSVKTGIKLLKSVTPDILLLDINLTDGTGFDILNKIGDLKFKIVFITAYDQYAIRAIKFSAFDYILKPIDPVELVNTIKKASTAIENEDVTLKLNALISNFKEVPESTKKIVLKTSESIFVVSLKQIIRCEADGSYTTFYLDDKRSVMVSKTIKEYEELLPDTNFFRSHQSHIVNVNKILSYVKKDGGYLLMEDNSQVPVSTRKKDDLMKILGNL